MNIPNVIQNFWSEVGSTKEFADPFFQDRFASHLNPSSSIVEYGCGYGRIFNQLWESGYRNLKGFDFAPKMIERGKARFPHLDLHLISETGKIPLADQTTDAVILSTVLCCNPEWNAQKKIIDEISRILKQGGILYLCDFLITHSEKFLLRYEKFAKAADKEFGTYRTSEGALVRHHSTQWIFKLLEQFDIQWLEQLDDVTMNGNSVRTIHLIAKKL